ncbi:MAG: hypothetical protein U1A78_40640 [Polyangia bacterium]
MLESVESKASGPVASALAGTTLNTFDSRCLQIDQLAAPAVPPADANLFVGADPADGTASRDFPACTSGAFIDWNSLGTDLANHRLLDCPGDPAQCANGKDPTSFPRSNECVGPSSVLSKMDLTYVAASSNSQFAYFAVQRANNNGDAAYYWIFTQKNPTQALGESPCRSDEKRLKYDITGSASATAQRDVLLVGHFHPSSEPLLRVYRARSSAAGLTAVQAIDFTNTSLWEQDGTGVAAVAVNTTTTRAGAFGATGVLAKSGTAPDENVEAEIFAEAAVPKSVFTGSSACGASFFGSVISRSSGSGGTSPDLKDLAGPERFNFGSISASASLTPTCGLAFGFQASATGTDGTAVANPSCSWSCSGGVVPSGCAGTQAAPVGSYSCSVTVTDPASGCVSEPISKTVQVCSPLGVSAAMSATCSSSFGYEATPSGGCDPNNIGYSWAFSGACGPVPQSSMTRTGTGTATAPGSACSGTVVARDLRTDIATCTATASATATPLAPLAVQIAPSATSLMCPMNSDAITFTPSVTGGNGSYQFTWNGPMCAGPSCTVDPSSDALCFDQVLSLTVTDTSGLCPPATSGAWAYSKKTTVAATPK